MPSTTPQQSARGFVAPSSAPIKKTPDITDVIGEKEVRGERYEMGGKRYEVEKEKGEREKGEESPRHSALDAESPSITGQGIAGQARNDDGQARKHEGTKEAEEIPSPLEEKVADGGEPPDDGRGDIEMDEENHNFNTSHLPPLTPHLSPLTLEFPTHWHAMFEHVFKSVPTIYIPLKETLPKIENNIIKVIVKNEIQKEHFEAKIREVLEFLRSHFNEQIEGVIVEANEQLETKKIIYDVKDKLQNFKEQNAEFEEFLQILDLKIKD